MKMTKQDRKEMVGLGEENDINMEKVIKCT